MEVESELDFSEFDGDGDGAVDVVILIVEGWGDGDNDQFWPHMSLIHGGSSGIGSIDITGEPIPTNDDGYFSLDGVAIKKYIVIPEQFHMNYFGVGKHDIHPIGTICHELGHVYLTSMTHQKILLQELENGGLWVLGIGRDKPVRRI